MEGAADVPRIRTELPGPRSREALARGERLLYRGLADELAPLVLESKSGYSVTDLDGNVFFDLASASASVPLGACREDLIEPAVEAIRRFGNEDSHAVFTSVFFRSSTSVYLPTTSSREVATLSSMPEAPLV